MVSSSSLELKLCLKPSYVPKTMATLLQDLSNVGNASDKLAVLNDYINQHEEELNSIVAFKRQLPQCMLLLMEALGTLKDEFMNIKNGMESENNESPLKEFLTIKKKHYEENQTDISSAEDNQKYDYKGKCLMSSSSSPHQLWNSNYEQQKILRDFIQAPNQNPIRFTLCDAEKRCSSIDREINYKRGSNNNKNNKNGGGGLKLRADNRSVNYKPRQPLTQPIWKNNRRAWSPELHARFVEALHLLGGIEAATPKQIREIMQVDGLTNDQVKSHLQKYRLHCRRLPESCAECMVNFQDPWHPQIYYGDPLPSENSDGNNSNPEGSLTRKS